MADYAWSHTPEILSTTLGANTRRRAYIPPRDTTGRRYHGKMVSRGEYTLVSCYHEKTRMHLNSYFHETLDTIQTLDVRLILFFLIVFASFHIIWWIIQRAKCDFNNSQWTFARCSAVLGAVFSLHAAYMPILRRIYTNRKTFKIFQ